MKIIVGLGNPSEDYRDTRHNIGFAALDVIAKKSDASFSLEKKLKAETAKGRLADKELLLLKPLTYVNESGQAVKKALDFYGLAPQDLTVIHDDLDLDFGKTKLSFGRGDGGHNGIRSIVAALSTNRFYRLRIGIANSQLAIARQQTPLENKKAAVGRFVLSRLSTEEHDKLTEIISSALDKLATLW